MEKGSFIWRALKVCKTFKVKFLKIPRLKVPAKKTASNLFYKDIWETKKWLKGVTISQASAIISKKSNKVKASEKKIEKYRKAEKRRYERTFRDMKNIIWTK